MTYECKQLERNWAILNDRESGMTFAAIGRKYGLSGGRVSVICESMASEKADRKSADGFDNPLEIPINLLRIGTRGKNCCANAGIRTVGDLVNTPVNSILDTPNFGRATFAEMRRDLERLGILWDTDNGDGNAPSPYTVISAKRDWLRLSG